MGKHETLTGAQRVAKRRAALRARGLRLKQFWIADTRDPKVREALRRECEEINRRDAETGAMDWVESLQADLWADEPDYDWGPEGSPKGTTGKQ